MTKPRETANDQDPKTPPEGTPPAAPAARATEPVQSADVVADDGRQIYTVTPRAGPKVAGQRVKAQQDIRLTPEEAASDLLSGAIVRKGETLHAQLRADAKPRDAKTDGEKAA